MMTINFKKLRITLVLLLLFIFSCRSTDADELVMKGGVAALKIDFTGAAYMDSADSQNSMKTADSRKKNIMIDPSTFIEVEIVSVGKSARSSVVPLKDAFFRVIVYEKATGNYKAHRDYSISNGNIAVLGGGNPVMELDGGVTYTIISYSYGIPSIPDISTGEKANIALAQIIYKYADTKDFMYESKEFTPIGGQDNVLKILLKHKVAEITVNLNADNNSNIEKVENASIAPHFGSGTISLINGSIIPDGTPVPAVVPFDGVAAVSKTSAPVLLNANTMGGTTGAFTADIIIGGISKHINTGSFFNITPGTRKNLNINIANTKKCGAYLGPNQTQWVDFMCYNLGANTNADPFSPSAAIHGAKYQWGGKDPVLTQQQDQNNSGSIVGWNSALAPDNSWTDSGKTSLDPCPAGYKVPSSSQWQKVIDNNVISYSGGSWSSGTAEYYNTVIKLGDRLVLPTAGHRNGYNGELLSRGSKGTYWSSTKSGSYSNYVDFVKGYIMVYPGFRPSGFSVRCIKE